VYIEKLNNERIKLNNLCSLLNENIDKLIIDNNFIDGRINSIVDEETILNLIYHLSNNWIKSKERSAQDFQDITFSINVNIKSSSFNNFDNVSSKTGFLEVFSDKKIPQDHLSYSKILLDLVENGLDLSLNNDYYYLLFNKNEKKFYLSSILSLKKVFMNPSNLPFQVKWKENYYSQLPLFQSDDDYITIKNNIFSYTSNIIFKAYIKRSEVGIMIQNKLSKINKELI
jgi:hypothetical protein